MRTVITLLIITALSSGITAKDYSAAEREEKAITVILPVTLGIMTIIAIIGGTIDAKQRRKRVRWCRAVNTQGRFTPMLLSEKDEDAANLLCVSERPIIKRRSCKEAGYGN